MYIVTWLALYPSLAKPPIKLMYFEIQLMTRIFVILVGLLIGLPATAAPWNKTGLNDDPEKPKPAPPPYPLPAPPPGPIPPGP